MDQHQLKLPSASVVFIAIVALMVVAGIIGGLLDGQTADTIAPQPPH